jgi:hypothetical protein
MAITVKYQELVTSEIILNVGQIIRDDTAFFNKFLERLKKLTFVAASCEHSEWKAFPSGSQGGRNLSRIVKIEILDIDEGSGRLALNVTWTGDQIAVVIFKDMCNIND